jgi:hypothetical protein
MTKTTSTDRMRKTRQGQRSGGKVSVTLTLTPAARTALGRPVEEGLAKTLSEAAEVLLVGTGAGGPGGAGVDKIQVFATEDQAGAFVAEHMAPG